MSAFRWSDDECYLLLCITRDYKIDKANEGVDWESAPTKYTDITAKFCSAVGSSKEATSEAATSKFCIRFVILFLTILSYNIYIEYI